MIAFSLPYEQDACSVCISMVMYFRSAAHSQGVVQHVPRGLYSTYPEGCAARTQRVVQQMARGVACTCSSANQH